MPPEATPPALHDLRDVGVNDFLLESLRTDQAQWALHHGRALAYPSTIGPFAALTEDTPAAWDDLAQATDAAFVAREGTFQPDGWALQQSLSLDTMISTNPARRRSPGRTPFRDLTAEDVPAMQRLTHRCGIHTFHPGSLAIAEYVGCFDDDRLIAMAGLRFSTPGWREVCCVATDPDHRGRGLAGQLIVEVINRAAESGRRPFLIVETDNPAIRLYTSLGFTHTRTDRAEHHTAIV